MSFVSRSSPAERAAFVEMQRRQREQVAEMRDEIARLTAERDRYLDTLGWYAVAEAWEVDADGGVRAFETLRDTGKFPVVLAAAKAAKDAR